jgi:dipeptidyl aminopeptidase/acylaminoacyl peptidase
MKEKSKGNPRRRLYWLLLSIVFLLGGYASLPYAQTAFVTWWEDDPFTPMCDVPHLELVYSKVNRLYHWTQGSEAEVFSQLQGEFSTLRWSPDFETLHVRMRAAGLDYQILRHSDDDIEVLPIDTVEWLWSPNGAYIAATSKNGAYSRLSIYDAQAADWQESATIRGGLITALAWSPNSQRIAFISSQTLNILEYVNGQWIEIFSVDVADDSLPVWSPDSELIAQGNPFLSIYQPSAHETLWRIEAAKAWAWGERGFIIDYSSMSAGRPIYEDIYFAVIESQSFQFLADTGHSFIEGWSESNEAILYSPDPMQLYILLFVNDDERYTFPSHIPPQFTPDGRYVSYQGDNGWLYLFDMESRGPCRLFEGELGRFSLYTWRVIPQS